CIEEYQYVHRLIMHHLKQKPSQQGSENIKKSKVIRKKVVHNKSMNVLVFFYAAEHSDSIPLFERIAELYKDVNDLLVAKMNVQLNYIPSFIRPSRTLPTVRLYETQSSN
ncbi:hypothetical protein COOONC_14486, partial [Cooperia oncophora]